MISDDFNKIYFAIVVKLKSDKKVPIRNVVLAVKACDMCEA